MSEHAIRPWWRRLWWRVTGRGLSYDDAAKRVRDAAVEAFNREAARQCITGFQGSWAALNAYAEIMGYDEPLTIIKASDYLYPQYGTPQGRVREWFESEGVQAWLAEQARQLLADNATCEDGRGAVPGVVAHWRWLAHADLEAPSE